jgi:hypothetical protein
MCLGVQLRPQSTLLSSKFRGHSLTSDDPILQIRPIPRPYSSWVMGDSEVGFRIHGFLPISGMSRLPWKGETVPMKKPAQHLIAEVPRRQAKTERTIGVDLGDVWSHYCALNFVIGHRH